MIPPPHLMVRVSGNADAETFQAVGARSAEAMMAAVDEWSPGASVLLDWGCGSGRVASHILGSHPGLVFRGCDIDAEAVAWCNEHIEAGSFDICPLYPPLPYLDKSFDVVIAVSVMTHLNRREQRRWLRELARVLVPGGLFVATVHGPTAAASFGVTDFGPIRDHYLNIGLAGLVPDGYYRDVIQTEAYTRMAWSERFEVVAYEEAAVELHDLVVCRRTGLRWPAWTFTRHCRAACACACGSPEGATGWASPCATAGTTARPSAGGS